MFRADVELAREAQRTHQVFTRASARAAGLSHSQIGDRLVSGLFVQLHQGVFTFAVTPPSFHRDLSAAVAAGGEGAFASGRSAAQLHRLPGATEELLEITCPRWRRTRSPSIVVHERVRVLPDDLVVVDGIRCSRPELTLIELAAQCGPAIAERAFHALRRERLATYESIERVMVAHARRGVRGVATVRALLERYGPTTAPTESELETTLLVMIRRHGFPEPETQVVVRDATGRFVGRADFGYPDLRIAILYHSRKWHATDEDNERDDSQRNQYWRARWIPIIARWNDVRAGGQEFAAALREAIAIRRGQLDPTLRHFSGSRPQK